MSAVSAVPAAVRLPRPAAARRALLTFLFLGGFLALAFVFGGSAQAASGPGHDVRDAGGASSGLVKSGSDAGSTASSTGKGKAAPLTKAELAAKHRREVRHATERTASHVVSPVAEGADRADEVTRPVGDAVDSASAPLGVGELPGHLGLGVGETIVGEGSGGDDAGDIGTDGPSGATAHDGGDRTDGPGTQGSRAMASSAASPGAAAATADDGVSEGDGDPADGLPFHRTPAVPAPSAAQCTGDGQGQRGGPHQHDAVVPGAEHFGPLQSGAVRAADGTPTRDSAGDVLEFPG